MKNDRNDKMFYKRKFKNFFLISIFLLSFIFLITFVNALNTVSTGYKFNVGETKTINAHGTQVTITNPINNPLFVPTKTKVEWDAFLNFYNFATEQIFTDLILWYGDRNHERYDILVVSELNTEQTERILEESFGNGDFSLFKTNPFIGKENSFNIYYYLIPEGNYAGRDKCVYGELSIKNIERFSSVFNNFDWVDYKIYITKDPKTWPHASSELLHQLIPSMYEDGRYIKISYTCIESNSAISDEHRPTNILEGEFKSIEEIDEYITSVNKSFELKVKELEKRKKFFYENNLGKVIIHEFGHMFGGLLDEYKYEAGILTDVGSFLAAASPVSTTQLKNCALPNSFFEIKEIQACRDVVRGAFELGEGGSTTIQEGIGQIQEGIGGALTGEVITGKSISIGSIQECGEAILNLGEKGVSLVSRESPGATKWKDVPGWDGKEFFGCTLQDGKRGTKNSIMRITKVYTPENWKDAWGPINEYYLRQLI